jgi:hypothetical protein
MKRIAALVGALLVSANVGMAQGTPPAPGQAGGRPMRPMMGMRGHRMRGRGERDQVAVLLDKQLVLQLTAQQVNQLITIHQQERQQAKPIVAKMQGLMPKDRDGWKNLTPATRDSMASVHEQLREIQWRAVSAASGVLTDEQKKIAAHLTEHPRFGRFAHGPMGRGFGPGGPRPGMRPGGQSDSSSGAHE